MTKEMIRGLVEAYGNEFIEMSQYLFEHPELSGEEFESAAYLKMKLEEHGFEIAAAHESLPTAFTATYKHKCDNQCEGPTIAFIAEYDALPGYGENKSAAHACGHNWIGASTCGAAIVLSKMALPSNATILVIGTPSEETTGAKVDLIRLGVFDQVDLAIQCHPENETLIQTRALAMDAIEFAFAGKAAHAAQYPHEGINALDAVQLTFAGINALRQHVKPDVRIHGIVTRGGDAPNIVPSDTACRFYVRSTDRKALNKVTEKVINCAKGAELMTGAKLSVSYFENPFDNLLHLKTLQVLIQVNMTWAGIEDISNEPEALPGSSDIGNVSYVVPTIYANVKTSHGPSVHEEAFLAEITNPYAMAQLNKTILAMAGAAFEVIENAELLALIKGEHARVNLLD